MARQSQIQFTIPEPCTIPWKGMIPVDTDQRYCSSCDKVVTDFSKMSDDELMLYFRHNNGKICGRLLTTQLNRPMNLLPEKTVNAKWWRTLILIPLTLFGKQAKAQYVEVMNQKQSPDTTVIVQQTDSLKSNVAANEKITANDSIKPNRDSLKLTLVKFDTTYQYAWKPVPVWTFSDSLHPYVIDIPPTTGGCVQIISIDTYTYPWLIPTISLVPFPLGPNPIPIEDLSDDIIYINPVDGPKSVLTIVMDTLVPFRKKKKTNHPVAGNQEEVAMQNSLKEVSDKPREKPKPQQPALPASNEFSAIMPAERKKWWRS
jgi:hypothetical protein